jgi:predicted nucleotidyltransferase
MEFANGLFLPIIGIKMPISSTIIDKPRGTVRGGRIADALFPTARQRLLGILYGQAQRTFLQAELIRTANVGSGAAQNELANLAAAELIERTLVGRQVFYRANRASPVFTELESLIRKTIGIGPVLKQNLSLLEHRIDRAFVFGSIAKGTEESQSDVDLLILTPTLSYVELHEVLNAASEALGRPVKPLIFSPREWKARLKRGDAFATRVENGPRIELVGPDA